MPRKKKVSIAGVVIPPESPSEPQKEFLERLKESSQTPGIGDIVQVTEKGTMYANIGIVHELMEDGETVSCYTPGRRGVPSPWTTKLKDVKVVGHALLKYKKPLPDDDAHSDKIDKI